MVRRYFGIQRLIMTKAMLEDFLDRILSKLEAIELRLQELHPVKHGKGRKLKDQSPEDIAFAQYMIDTLGDRLMTKVRVNYWADEIRKIRTIDNIPLTKIKSIFDWAIQDDFWQNIIFSPQKLRKHKATIASQMGAVLSPPYGPSSCSKEQLQKAVDAIKNRNHNNTSIHKDG